MSWQRLKPLPLLLFLAYASSVSADNDPSPRAVANVAAKGLDQIVYKGLVGNVLDEIPMDPSKRVSLQRTNAILSNTLSGHTLAALAGLSNPVLLIGGLVWGVWSASNIKPEEDGMKAISDPVLTGVQIAKQEAIVAFLDRPSATNRALAKHLPETASATSISAGEQVEPARVRAPVVKVWLPQRASTAAQ
jgi:hypothetical protein